MARSRSGDLRFGKLELEMMKAVWDRGEATVHDVQQALEPRRRRAYSTILTMMRKLEAKGYLTHAVQDRAYVYRPTVTRREVRQSLLADLVDRVFDGSARLVVTGLIQDTRLSEKELAEIRRLLDERGADGGQAEG